jgi:hypothetical protein
MAGTEPPRNLTIAERGEMANKTGNMFTIFQVWLGVLLFPFERRQNNHFR